MFKKKFKDSGNSFLGPDLTTSLHRAQEHKTSILLTRNNRTSVKYGIKLLRNTVSGFKERGGLRVVKKRSHEEQKYRKIIQIIEKWQEIYKQAGEKKI